MARATQRTSSPAVIVGQAGKAKKRSKVKERGKAKGKAANGTIGRPVKAMHQRGTVMTVMPKYAEARLDDNKEEVKKVTRYGAGLVLGTYGWDDPFRTLTNEEALELEEEEDAGATDVDEETIERATRRLKKLKKGYTPAASEDERIVRDAMALTVYKEVARILQYEYRKVKNTNSKGKDASDLDVPSWFRSMSKPPTRRAAYLFYEELFWTEEMEAEVDQLTATATGIAIATGEGITPRQALINHVSAEHLKVESEEVVEEVMEAREDHYKEELREWEEQFTGEPLSVEAAEAFAAQVNVVLEQMASYVAKRISGICVWYTAGPKEIYRAEGCCDLPGRTVKLFSEVQPRTHLGVAAQIMAQSTTLNERKWGEQMGVKEDEEERVEGGQEGTMEGHEGGDEGSVEGKEGRTTEESEQEEGVGAEVVAKDPRKARARKATAVASQKTIPPLESDDLSDALASGAGTTNATPKPRPKPKQKPRKRAAAKPTIPPSSSENEDSDQPTMPTKDGSAASNAEGAKAPAEKGSSAQKPAAASDTQAPASNGEGRAGDRRAAISDDAAPQATIKPSAQRRPSSSASSSSGEENNEGPSGAKRSAVPVKAPIVAGGGEGPQSPREASPVVGANGREVEKDVQMGAAEATVHGAGPQRSGERRVSGVPETVSTFAFAAEDVAAEDLDLRTYEKDCKVRGQQLELRKPWFGGAGMTNFLCAVPKKLEGGVDVALACRVATRYLDFEFSGAVEGTVTVYDVEGGALPAYTADLIGKTSKTTWNKRAQPDKTRTKSLLDCEVDRLLPLQWTMQQPESRRGDGHTLVQAADASMDWEGRLPVGRDGVRLLVVTLLAWGWDIKETGKDDERAVWERLARDFVDVLEIVKDRAGPYEAPTEDTSNKRKSKATEKGELWATRKDKGK